MISHCRRRERNVNCTILGRKEAFEKVHVGAKRLKRLALLTKEGLNQYLWLAYTPEEDVMGRRGV
jgi:hypothetical protein